MSTLALAPRIAARKLLLWARRFALPSPLPSVFPRSVADFCRRVVDSGSVYRILGSRMYIPPPERNSVLLKGVYEPAVTALLAKLLSEGLTFCDVGANIGVFTLLAAKLVGPRGLVIAIEPVPEVVDVLRKNVAINGYRNVVVLQNAVDLRPGVATIHLSGAYGCHSLFPAPYMDTRRTLTVQALRLDSLPQMRQVSVLEIDAEGAELLALRSLGSLRPPNVVLEYNSERQQAAGVCGSRFLDELRALGYRNITDLDDVEHGLDLICKEDPISHNLHLRTD